MNRCYWQRNWGILLCGLPTDWKGVHLPHLRNWTCFVVLLSAVRACIGLLGPSAPSHCRFEPNSAGLRYQVNKAILTFDIFWVVLIDFLVSLQSLLERPHSSVARSYHQLPLDFCWFYLCCSHEIFQSIFEYF